MTGAVAQWHQVGRQLQEQGQLDRAEHAYRQVLALEPDRLLTLNNLAVLLMAQERFTESSALLVQGLTSAAGRWGSTPLMDRTALAYEWALLLNTASQWALHHDQFEQARSYSRLQLQLQPQGSGLANLGVALSWLNKAAAACRSQWLGLGGGKLPEWPQEPLAAPLALWTEAESPTASACLHLQLCNLATALLARDPLFPPGWELLLARLATEPQIWADSAKPWQGLWGGEPLERLVVWDEQGYGDALQCLRWLPAAAERVHHLTLLLRPALLELVKQRLPLPAHCRIEVFDPARDRPWARGIVHSPLMALPAALFSDRSEIALASTPVFVRRAAPPQRSRQFGLVWAAGQKHNLEARRSARLRSLPGDLLLEHACVWAEAWQAELLSLQLGPELEQARPWIASGAVSTLEAGGDWLATAEQVERLDLVITVDTAMVHLAGSLGVPCVLLLNQVCDWRWFAEDCPVAWYPSVRILRATVFNSWDALLQQVPAVIDAMLAP